MNRNRLVRPALFAALVLTHVAGSAQGRVWHVAPSGGHAPQISDAVSLARSGDVILVATAATPYAGFNSYGKALTIMSADAGKPQVLGQSDVWGVPSGSVFRIANLRFKGRDRSVMGGDAYAFTFSANPTTPPVTFVMSGCDVESGRGYWPPQSPSPLTPAAAIYVDAGASSTPTDHVVILDRVRAIGHDQAKGLLAGDLTLFANECFFQGGDAMLLGSLSTYVSHSGPGAGLQHGSFYFAETDMRGGSVPSQVYAQPQNGGDGLVLDNDAKVFVFARRATIVGGNSGNLGVGGRGGYGLNLWFTTSQTYVDGQPFIGGMTLAGSVGQVPPVFGTPAPIARKLGASSFDRTLADLGTMATVSLIARPQEPHLLLATPLARQVPLNGILEPLPAVGMPLWFPLAFLTADGSGNASLQLGIPTDSALSAQTLFVQGIGLGIGDMQLVVDSLCALTLR